MSFPEGRLLRLAVTGQRGQIVQSLIESGPAQGVAVIPIGRPLLDLAQPATVAAALLKARPDLVVNAAAYTAVDKAESEPDIALAVNGAGAGAVARTAANLGVPVVQLSTDYVFDGMSPRAYREEDPVGPLSAYGRSKRAGEEAVADATDNHAILRTAWVYSPFGTNFVKTMLRVAENRDAISVVADQRGCPTSALDIAEALLKIARTLLRRPEDATLRGTFHMTGTGETTWAGFAAAIFAESKRLGGPSAEVIAIETADYPTPARRPPNARLDGTKLEHRYNLVLPPWQTSLRTCVERLIKGGAA